MGIRLTEFAGERLTKSITRNPAREDRFMRIVMALNGVLSESVAPSMRESAASSEVVIGVDGGSRHFIQWGIDPTIVTGDFDSLTPQELSDFANRGIRIIPTPDQDYTDFDKALQFVEQEYPGASVRVFAATGGRLDHVYSVLSVLVKHGRHLDIRLIDETGETWLCHAKETLTGEDLPGRTLSLMALGQVSGITTTGLRWPLTNEFLAPGVRDGTLNEVAHDAVTIQVEQGDLLLLLHHREFSDAIWKAKSHQTKDDTLY